MLSRRGFLIGAGGLLTAAFVTEAQSFVLRNEHPLLVPPPQITQTMFWYDNDEQGLMLTIGKWDVCPPPRLGMNSSSVTASRIRRSAKHTAYGQAQH